MLDMVPTLYAVEKFAGRKKEIDSACHNNNPACLVTYPLKTDRHNNTACDAFVHCNQLLA